MVATFVLIIRNTTTKKDINCYHTTYIYNRKILDKVNLHPIFSHQNERSIKDKTLEHAVSPVSSENRQTVSDVWRAEFG